LLHRNSSLCTAWALACALAGPGWGQQEPAGPTPAHTFGRGFDLDRGTEFSVTLGGIPMNLPSTVWGPGYLDTNLWIPELEGAVEPRRGPHPVEAGGCALAGSVRKDLVDQVERPTLTAEYGGAEADRFGRLLWMASRPAGGAILTWALEGTRNGRPWDELDPPSKLNAAFRLGRAERDSGWDFTVLATQEKGDGGAPDPLRPTSDEDELHEGDGIRTRRLLLGAGLLRGATRLQAYAGFSSQQAWGDYTYFLHDAGHGDQRERLDRRGFLGLDLSRQWTRPGLDTQAGFQARVDQVAAAEVYATQDRVRLQPLLQGQAELLHGALYGQSTASLGADWRASLGLRLDTQSNQVRGAAIANHGLRTDTLLSPRLGLGWSPAPDTDFNLSHSRGFRPGNAFRDSRPMTRAYGTDLGAQTRLAGPWVSGVTFWTLDLDAETGLDPGLNAYVEQGRSRRQGLEWHNLVRSGPWSAELSLDWTRARFRDRPGGSGHVPGAMARTASLALGWQASSRSVKATLKRFGAYPLTPDNSVRADPQDALELKGTQDWGGWSFSLAVLNAFDKRKYNQEYCYPSRLSAESSAVPDRHARNADAQAIRVEVTRRF